jgi:hypothetical protein
MGPYVVPDADGDSLSISEANEGVFMTVTEDGHSCRMLLETAGIAGVCAAMHEQAGQPVPLVLPRVKVYPDVSADDGEFRVWLSDGGTVIFGFGGGVCVERSPDGAERTAALIAGYAEAARARQQPELDPSRVDELATVLVEGRNAMGLDGARPLARRILAAGWTREARDDG